MRPNTPCVDVRVAVSMSLVQASVGQSPLRSHVLLLCSALLLPVQHLGAVRSSVAVQNNSHQVTPHFVRSTNTNT